MTHKKILGGAATLIEPAAFQPIRATDDGGVGILHGGHHSGVVGAAAQTLNVPNQGARYVLIQALTQNVRITVDGTTPTASLGFQLVASDPPLLIPLSEHTIIKVFREAAGATLEWLFGE